MDKKEKECKGFPVLPVVLGIVFFCLAAAYIGGVIYYQDHFVRGTAVDQVEVSGKTIADLNRQVEEYMLRIVERKSDGTTLEEDIQGNKIALAYASMEPLEEILSEQNAWLWFLPQNRDYDLSGTLTYDRQALKQEIGKLKGFQSSFASAPTDAHIGSYAEEIGFAIEAETQGNQLKRLRTEEVIEAAVASLAELVDLSEEGCYEEPSVTSQDERLQAALKTLKRYENLTITYIFGDEQEILDGSRISSWLQTDGFEVVLDIAEVEEYVASLRKKYDSIFRSRTFLTSYGEEITINGGDYGWWMNYGQEAKELAEMIQKGESGERTPVYYQTAAAYGTPDYGTTYVEINLTAQHLFFYKDGELIMESDLVSGNEAKGYDTPEGVYGITYKQRNATLKGETYETPVSYWMPFNKNIGMHDATWRASFGGTIYKKSGSHGCINLPYAKAQELYGYIEKGTPVICYHLPGTEKAKE